MKINNRTCTITLTNHETRTLEGDARDADELGGVIRQAAHDMAHRTGRHVEVYATARGGQSWVTYACEV